MLAKEQKKQIINKFAKTDGDTGSTAVQIAIVTERIKQISQHLQSFPKDKHSRHGLVRLVGQKRSLCQYLARKDKASYEKLMATLDTKKKKK